MKADTLLPPVLVVDDDDDDVHLLARRLKTAGVTNPILHFRDGGSAYVYLKDLCHPSPAPENLPSVMFLDVNMEGLSGFDVLIWTRQQASLQQMKIFMLSGSNEIWDAQIAAKLGANEYLEKFPEPAALRALLAPVCRIREDPFVRNGPA
jgi:CheY-like chemotaxis protein